MGSLPRNYFVYKCVQKSEILKHFAITTHYTQCVRGDLIVSCQSSTNEKGAGLTGLESLLTLQLEGCFCSVIFVRADQSRYSRIICLGAGAVD